MSDSHTRFDSAAFTVDALGVSATLAGALLAGVANLRRAQEQARFDRMGLAHARAHAAFESAMRIRAIEEHAETARRNERQEIELMELRRDRHRLLALLNEGTE